MNVLEIADKDSLTMRYFAQLLQEITYNDDKVSFTPYGWSVVRFDKHPLRIDGRDDNLSITITPEGYHVSFDRVDGGLYDEAVTTDLAIVIEAMELAHGEHR